MKTLFSLSNISINSSFIWQENRASSKPTESKQENSQNNELDNQTEKNNTYLATINQGLKLAETPETNEAIQERNTAVIGQGTAEGILSNVRINKFVLKLFPGKDQSLETGTAKLDIKASLLKNFLGGDLNAYGTLKTDGLFINSDQSTDISGHEAGLKWSTDAYRNDEIGKISISGKAQATTKMKNPKNITGIEVGTGIGWKIDDFATKMEFNLQNIGIEDKLRTEIINYLKYAPFDGNYPALEVLNYHYFENSQNTDSNTFLIGLVQKITDNVSIFPNMVIKTKEGQEAQYSWSANINIKI